MIENDELEEIINSVRDGIWDNYEFTLQKAYITSILSEMAYLHIPEFERQDINRLKIIPCRKYWTIIEEEKSFDIRRHVQRNASHNEEIKVVFIIETRNIISIGIKCRNVLFVTLRGTHHIYRDNLVNIKARKVKRRYNEKYHSGFYREVSRIYGKFKRELGLHTDNDTKVVFTGHSLGGALATILYKACLGRAFRHTYYGLFSCFVFGMPRVGNSYATECGETHYSILNKLDVIPTLPSRYFGYSDAKNEFYLTYDSLDAILIREKFGKVTWLRQWLNKLQEHRIGEYKRRLKNLMTI
ncbi:putative lipase [Paenibacillus sp. V4I9]|uniref:lipase family protein n=1 Tax=Paenibacillus sp. V4I9 TaxID=3042308 RepID=UPI002780476E|nr:lipase family protein [Paenibacillus sp. V4I9]MDQ0885913.1 putative lipase [Paenibacillus sp. V4I9]